MKFIELKTFLEKHFSKYLAFYYKPLDSKHILTTVDFKKIDLNNDNKELKKFLGIFVDEKIPTDILAELLIPFITDIMEKYDYNEEIINELLLVYYVSKVHKDKFINKELKRYLKHFLLFFVNKFYKQDKFIVKEIESLFNKNRCIISDNKIEKEYNNNNKINSKVKRKIFIN